MQEVKTIFMSLQEIYAIFSFEGKHQLWELEHLVKDLRWKGNRRMTLELYNSMVGHVLLHVPCNKFFIVKDFRNTSCTSYSRCPYYVFLCRRRGVIWIFSRPLKVLVFTTKNIQSITIELLSKSCFHRLMRVFFQ